MTHITKIRILAARIAVIAALSVSSFGLAASASANAAPAIKPVPQAPTQNTLSAPLASKDQIHTNSATPAIAWTASLSASSTSLWPTQYTTLTTATNQDVGPTPYYLSIYDNTAAANVAICGTGTTCTASVTQPTATTHSYTAYVSGYPSVHPPTNIQATSGTVSVTWKGLGISLQAPTPTAGVNGNVTLTSTASTDLGPTPFYAEIVDTNTNTVVGSPCGFTTTCTAYVAQAIATTHRFVAYISSYSTSLPLSNVQATSNAAFGTWNNNGYRATSLTTARTAFGQDTVTATTNVNVGPTPYYIEIFNTHTGARVAVCGTGTSCSGTASLSFGRNDFVAFVSGYSTSLPPVNTQANSTIATDYFFIIIRP
jgi:hypothetical protein